MDDTDRTTKGDELEGVVNALLLALAIQAGETNNARFAHNALEELADQPRKSIRTLLGYIGHLVHYGCAAKVDEANAWLAGLFEQLLATLRRASDRGVDDFLPGDLVELTVDRLSDHLRGGTVLRIYVVGDDGTADVGFESLKDEYLIFTIELVQLRRRGNVPPAQQ